MKKWNILLAPNSFKGSLSSVEASEAIAEGLKQSGLVCEITQFPIADGGNDTMKLLTTLRGGQFIETQVQNPLGATIVCKYGWVPHQNTAIIGLSEASGIHLLQNNDIMLANTYGTGQQILDALSRGATTIITGVGGSATTDGGTGILGALGIRFLDKHQVPVRNLPMGLPSVKSVDNTGLYPPSRACKFIVLCDVENPLLGTNGTARIFAPQKGAAVREIQMLENCLHKWNQLTLESTGIDMAELKYGGAAGGASAGLYAWLHAELISGIEYFLTTFNFDTLFKKTDVVITGEGQLDCQTLKGKGPYGITRHAKDAGIPVVVFCGVAKQKDKLRWFDEIIEINTSGDVSREMKYTKENLRAAARLWAETLKNHHT